MVLQDMDFQAIVHQQVTELMDTWNAAGITEAEIQENASQFFNMGLIAAQQVQQEGGVQPQGSEQTIPYTEPMATNVIRWFLQGLNTAALKAFEQRIPSQEKWQLIQNVAYHVFEQSKQAAVATFGQESTPDVQISDEQINNWLGQTAVEAFLYYISEHEKQHGPIARTDEPGIALQPEPEPVAQYEEEIPLYQESPEPEYEEPVVQKQEVPAAPAKVQPSDIHHKYAAVGLLLNTVSTGKQLKILAAFQPQEQEIINQYRDPEAIAKSLDLGLVAQYLRSFKEKLGQDRIGIKSKYATTLSGIIETLPSNRLERLFQNERPIVRGYVQQFVQKSTRKINPYTLPPGVEESLVLYLHRNFPEETAVR